MGGIPVKAPPEVRIPGTEAWRLTDSGGREHALWLAIPDTPPPAAGFPLLLLLDGQITFGTAVDFVRMRARRPDSTGVPPAVIAALSPGDGANWHPAARTADFTTPREEGGSPGNAEAFGRFLREEVLPLIERRGAVDPAGRALFGHSLAGYFVLHTFLTHPSPFSRFIAASPSVWWDREHLFRAAGRWRSLFGSSSRSPRLFVGVGEFEETLAPWQENLPDPDGVRRRRKERRMIEDARALVRRLEEGRSTDRTSAAFELFPMEDHASILPAVLGRTLRFALGPES